MTSFILYNMLLFVTLLTKRAWLMLLNSRLGVTSGGRTDCSFGKQRQRGLWPQITIKISISDHCNVLEHGR
jgi:hypothetical protein